MIHLLSPFYPRQHKTRETQKKRGYTLTRVTRVPSMHNVPLDERPKNKV